ncbi:MAG: hypothetical protein CO035_01310, partial [Candidatus Omnitrophica bacterium CG_4_9_14_0_2_um_filter_42_8]
TNSRIGVGTTNPTGGTLHVLGHCIVEDSTIRVKRKKKKRKQSSSGSGSNNPPNPDNEDDEYEYLNVAIQDVLPGDEILSFNDINYQFEYKKVEKTLDKDTHKVYRVTTENGLYIETTKEHPFFVQEIETISYSTVFEVDQSNRIEDLSKDSFVTMANRDLSFTVKLGKKEKLHLLKYHQKNRKSKFGFQVFAQIIVYIAEQSRYKIDSIVIDHEYTGYEDKIKSIIKRGVKASVSFASIGKKSSAHIYALNTNRGIELPNIILSDGDFVETKKAVDKMSKGDLHQEWLPEFSALYRTTDLTKSYQNLPNIASGKWKKVAELKVGQRLATVDGWSKIVSIKEVGCKHVYDLQIADTHTFIANGIVAHNTYLQGAGTTTGFSLQTADSTGADKFVVTNAGNVGIGTTAPASALEIGGSGNLRVGGLTASL